ncbi:hypothetical protein FQN54_008871 [Arachnomyces sp. PD_36]|nr:hypothetical protein FQN54_008871 [Arachnomyces sp. PD_36]
MSAYNISSAACGLARQQTSPAAIFVRHCRRSLSSATGASSSSKYKYASRHYSTEPVLEFLLPARYPLRLEQRRSAPRSLPSFQQPLQRRSQFSTTTTNNAAAVLLNPRNDEDGKPMWMEISPRAAERLRQITDPSTSPSTTTPQKENPHNHLRVTVTSGGCHGFQYLMSLEPSSKIDPEEDTVFEAEPAPSELESESEGGVGGGGGKAKVVMDEPSLELLHGSTIDYTMELIGSQFKIVDNPRASSNCGCGTSFDVQ